MTKINSVLGPIDTANLGFTLMHEHIMYSAAGVFRDYPELLGTDLMKRVADGLKKASEGGIDTIVDATTLDLGRDVHLLAEASRRSGVNIIACTGWWLDIPPYFTGISADQLAEVFSREIEVGISETDIKAGILKAASGLAGVTPEEETVLRAVARSHLKTGTPIMLHSHSPGRVAQQQLAILREEGVELKRVKVDHCSDTADVDYLVWLLEQGCYLGMDRFPGRSMTATRIHTLKALLEAGYAHHLCPSHDHAIITTKTSIETMEGERMGSNPYGYLYIKNVVFPQLQEMGVPESIIKGLCIDGPRDFFEGI